MTKDTDPATDAGQRQRAQARIDRLLTILKVVLVLALLRMLAGAATKDLLGQELVPLPTWEWVLCALTPTVLLFLCRSPTNWRLLKYDIIYVQSAASLYLLYAMALVIFQGEWMLWTAVISSLGTFLGIWWLNRRERTHAR